VLRSTAGATSLVQRRLNHGLAITLCCTANSVNSPPSTSRARQIGPTAPSSIPLGTPTPARNPTV
jgi:hypothetical protein